MSEDITIEKLKEVFDVLNKVDKPSSILMIPSMNGYDIYKVDSIKAKAYLVYQEFQVEGKDSVEIIRTKSGININI